MARREAAAKPVIAEKDCVITDARGLRVRVVKGSEVPKAYVDAYEDEVGGSRKAKAERAPQTDKAERAPERSK